MKGLTNNILIFSLSDFPPRSLLLINRSPPSLHAFFHFNLIPSASSSSSRSLSLFSQYVGDVFPHIHIHIHIQPLLVANPPPILQSRCLAGSAPILWPSNPLDSRATVNITAWCREGGINHATFNRRHANPTILLLLSFQTSSRALFSVFPPLLLSSLLCSPNGFIL